MKPDISVIIPVLNNEKTIRVLIDSINSQTKYEVEYLFVVDGSFDDTFAMLKHELKDNRMFTVVKNKGIHGLIGSIAYGLSKSKGKYVMIAKEGIKLFPEYCEKAYDIICSNNSDIAQFLPEVAKKEYFFDSDGRGVDTEIHVSTKDIVSTEGSLFSLNEWKDFFNPQIVCNKIYNGNLAREIAIEINNNNLSIDSYGFNVLFSMKAHNCVGRNISLYASEQVDSDNMNMLSRNYQNGLMTFCKYLEEKEELYELELKQDAFSLRRHYVLEAIDRCLDCFDKKTKSELFEEIINVWGLDSLVDAVSITSVQERSDLANAFKSVDFFKAKKRDPGKFRNWKERRKYFKRY